MLQWKKNLFSNPVHQKSKWTDTSEMILRVTRDLHLFCLRSHIYLEITEEPSNRVLKPWTPPSPLALPVNNINLLTCLLFSLILVFSTGVISMCPCSKFMAKCRVKLYILMPEGSVLKTLKNKALFISFRPWLQKKKVICKLDIL